MSELSEALALVEADAEAGDLRGSLADRVAAWGIILAAAGVGLDGRNVWWCEEHGASAWDGRGEFCVWKPGLPEDEDTPCRMKQVRIIDVGDSE